MTTNTTTTTNADRADDPLAATRIERADLMLIKGAQVVGDLMLAKGAVADLDAVTEDATAALAAGGGDFQGGGDLAQGLEVGVAGDDQVDGGFGAGSDTEGRGVEAMVADGQL